MISHEVLRGLALSHGWFNEQHYFEHKTFKTGLVKGIRTTKLIELIFLLSAPRNNPSSFQNFI